MILYILENKEWIFSGIGIFMFGVIGFLVKPLFKKKDGNLSSGNSNEIHPETASKVFMYLLMFLLGVLFVIGLKKVGDWRLTNVERLKNSFEILVKSEFPSRPIDIKIPTYVKNMIGDWEVNLDSVGFIKKNSSYYNVLVKDNNSESNMKFVFCPIESRMKIWCTHQSDSISELRGLEFVEIAILNIPDSLYNKEYNEDDIDEYSVTTVGTIFSSKFEIIDSVKTRSFFNVAYVTQFNSEHKNIQSKVNEFLLNIANFKVRDCEKIENNGKMLKFAGCKYGDFEYIRLLRTRN